jgi:hypothetical protein
VQILTTIAALVLGGGGAALAYQWRIHRRDQRILDMWERGYDETGNVAILVWMSLSGGDAGPASRLDNPSSGKHEETQRTHGHEDAPADGH